jgi:AbiV family abortive infection protein
MKEEIAQLLEFLPCDNNLIRHVDEFDAACDHILEILEESEMIFSRGGFSTSVFLSITAIEETAKAHLGMFTGGGPDPEQRKGNIFFQHKKKHQLAAQQTVGMGSRLNEALGAERVQQLLRESLDGKLLDQRESALYFQRVNGSIVTPRSTITAERARELLLLAIETFDDALVGFSNHSMIIDKRSDVIFSKIANA